MQIQLDIDPDQIPPYAYIKYIARHAPASIDTFLKLWEFKDLNNKITIDKNRIWNTFLIDHVRFKKDIARVCELQLLNINETKKQYHIELVGWSDEEMEAE